MKRLVVMAVLGVFVFAGLSGTAFADKRKAKFNFDFRVFSGPQYPAPCVAYAPPVYVQRVYVPPVYETQVTREFIIDGYRLETRTEVSPSGNIRYITVKVPYGHYEERATQILVRDGYYQDVPVAAPAPMPVPRPATTFSFGFNIHK